jgi:hypothetical protein
MACHGGASLARVQFGRAERELPGAMEAGDFDEPYLSAYRSLIGGCNALPGVTTAADLREILGGVPVCGRAGDAPNRRSTDYSGLAPLGAVTILIRTTRPQPITAYTTIATSEALSKVLVFVPVSPKIPVNGATITPLS